MLGRPGCWLPRLDEGDGGIVIDGVGVDGLDDGDVVDDFRGVGQQLADPGAGLVRSCWNLKMERRDGQGALAGGHAGDALAHADGAGQFGAGEFVERRLVIEEIDLRGPAGLVEVR